MSDWKGISLGDEARLRLEVNRLRAERDAYKAHLDAAEARCKELEIRIHRPFTISGRNHPAKDMCLECLADYPCQRLAALDGDPTG